MSRRSLSDAFLAAAAKTHALTVKLRFARALRRATRTQAQLLDRLVARGAASAFGCDHRFDRIRDYESYRSRVPIRAYDELSPYVKRIMDGDLGALFPPGERILMFALTSGTTAEPKYVPITPNALADCRRGWNIWGVTAILDHPEALLRDILQVTSPMCDHLAPSGVPCGAITGLLAATQKRLVQRYYTSPLAISAIKDAAVKYYTIMRFAVPKDVAWAVTANPSTFLLLAKSADENRERLIRDVRDGTLCRDMAIEGDIRTALAPLLRPDPDGARRLEAIVSKHGSLRPKHYWRLSFLAHWTGGTMGLYRPQLPAYFGEVPSRDIGLIASEGRMSIPLADNVPGGVIAVTSQFFEFIPAADHGAAQPVVLRSHELTLGEEYFVILTNMSGLYRYDIGDCVRVVGFLGEAPLIEFLSRDAHTASLAGEKLTEHQVVEAMQAVCGAGPGRVERFILSPRWADPPHYRLYVEAQTVRGSLDLAGRLDAALGRVNNEYESKRKTLRLGPVQLAELPAGALAERDLALRRQRSRTAEQFKQQYLLPRPGLDAELQPPVECR